MDTPAILQYITHLRDLRAWNEIWFISYKEAHPGYV